ncbi:amino acid permease-domain-containing protein [Fimicolochytrium jonesii]|uniref:amino acid permease-domain-containing protein n=1 Tax=Fimicolochytrium jonesii TaxID=1396493 RepID=UPI0022FE9918|nr:amino acid permease-domain-containing protein [Fimicolochytrium jonesii]KAI8825615.1 amino acid permease-domain-containing protein [Fimicolochytrium jonesii]
MSTHNATVPLSRPDSSKTIGEQDGYTKDPNAPLTPNTLEGQAAADGATSELPQGRQLGVISATFLIVNRIVGTGVFATTSTILAQSGSTGMSLIYWAIGAVIAVTGYLVYAEFASAIPRNGGELNYLQHIYKKPRFLVASMYAAQALLLGQAAGNAYTAGRYLMRAGGQSNEWGSRGIGVLVLVAALIVHGTMLKWGLRFQNVVGLFKLVILVLIAFTGFAALAGKSRANPPPDNFTNAFEGTRSDLYGIVSCIYNAVWSYVGYSNIFYALGEIRTPVRTIKIAGPLALGVITVLYMLVQVAYFAAVPRDQILGGSQIVASLFFQNMFGESSARALSVFVALSATANVFSVIFSQGRLNQALGRDGIVPFSKILASNRPFKSPLAGLTWHVIVTLVILLAPPAGDAYDFVLNLSSYPLNVVNAAVALGLLSAYLPHRLRPQWAKTWSPSIRASLPVVLFFTLISLFLVIAPWIAPSKPEEAVYKSLWYAIAPAVSVAFFVAGATYWLVWFVLLPRVGRYTLVPVQTKLKDGTPVTVFVKETAGHGVRTGGEL